MLAQERLVMKSTRKNRLEPVISVVSVSSFVAISVFDM